MSVVPLGNAPRWNSVRDNFHEAWSITCNHGETQAGFQLRFTVDAPATGKHGSVPIARLWFARFDARRAERSFGLVRSFPLASVNRTATPFELRFGPHRISDGASRGAIAGGGHDARWDLHWDAAVTPLALQPQSWLGGASRTRVATSPRVALTGEIVVDGVRATFNGEFATQDHSWGDKRAERWSFGRCLNFDSHPTAQLEVSSVRKSVARIALPAMTVATLVLDGEHLLLSDARHMIGNHASWDTGVHRFEVSSLTTRVVGELSCRPNQMLFAPVDHPDGSPGYLAYSAIADARVTVHRRSGFGFREAATLLGTACAHLDQGQRERYRLIPAVYKVIG